MIMWRRLGQCTENEHVHVNIYVYVQIDIEQHIGNDIKHLNTTCTCITTVQPASVAQLDAPSDWKPGGRGFNLPPRSATFFRGLIMKYFLRSFSPVRWFKKGSCQFLAKECAQYWLTA